MTAQQLLDKLLEILPGFRAAWGSADNLFVNDDGSFTECGVFAACSHFIRDNYDQLSAHQRSQLGSVVTQCMETSDTPLSDAAATCFLENLSDEPISKDFEGHLSGEALDFYRLIERS